MRIRTGFVSNSSGSSFVIVSKKELTREMLEKTLSVPKEHPLHSIANKIINLIMENSRELEGDDKEEEKEYRGHMLSKGSYMYSGYFSNEEYGVENMLSDTELNIETEDFVMEHKIG